MKYRRIIYKASGEPGRRYKIQESQGKTWVDLTDWGFFSLT